MRTRIAVLLPAAIALILSAPAAYAEVLLSIEDPEPYTIQSAGFELPRDADIAVEAVGIGQRRSDDLAVYAWILDSETRRPVWVMERRDTDRLDRSRVLRKAEKKLHLKQGRYELYLFTGLDWQGGIVDLSGLGKIDLDLSPLKDLEHLFGDRSWKSGSGWSRDDDDRDAWDSDRDERDRDRAERDWDREERDRDRDQRDWDREERDERRYDEQRKRSFDEERQRRDDDEDDDWNDDDQVIILKDGRTYRLGDRGGRWRYDDLIEDNIDRCNVKVSSDDLRPAEVRSFEVTGGFANALIRHNRLGDGEFSSTGFRLTRPMSLHVYSVFEYPRDAYGPADFAWIVEANTRELVWHPRKRDTHRAGGGAKNRVIDAEVELPAGSYILYCGTDDSHSFERFNVMPPYDPVNWGVTVLPGRDFDRSAFTITDIAARPEPLISHERAEDYDHFEQSFHLDRPAKLIVLALGEYDESDDEFVDYGYIADARTGEPVWRMQRRNTIPGGGASKNRRFEGEIELPAGDYTAVYVTDDSHSYEEWNSAAPFEPKAWGMTIYPGPGFDRSAFRKLDRAELPEDPDVLVRMVRVGDSERLRETFTLDQPTRIRIHALGEGTHGRMYDYGRIEEEGSGRVVWEMEYRDTERAGGAKKNRVFDGTIRLPAGTYRAIYRTDGSHSFEDWNDAQPREPWLWGMTIRRAE